MFFLGDISQHTPKSKQYHMEPGPDSFWTKRTKLYLLLSKVENPHNIEIWATTGLTGDFQAQREHKTPNLHKILGKNRLVKPP